MSRGVTGAECDRLDRIADLVQVELQTWLEGNGITDDGGRWYIPATGEEWLKVRCHKLGLAVRDLRKFSLKHRPEDYQI